jgi:hypothetical protein
MLALSVRQPWVYSIFHLGKTVENRVWQTDYRGPILIHASGRFNTHNIQVVRHIMKETGRDPDIVPYCGKIRKDDPNFPYTKNALIGTVDLVDCVHGHDSKWYMGKEIFDERRNKMRNNYALVLANPRLLPTPISYKGKLGLFEVPDEIWRKAA